MEQQIKINRIARTFGTALTVHGFKMLKSSYSELISNKLPFSFIKSSFDRVKVIPITQIDLNYYFTNWNNWEEMLGIIRNIIKNFKWEEDKFDCDNRAKLVNTLCSLFFGMNSCGEIYCQVTNIKTGRKDYHWTNVVVTSNGELYLFDVDQQGLWIKLIPNKPIVIGKWSYNFLSAKYS